MTEQDKLEEIYLLLSDLRVAMHRENTFEEYEKRARDYYARIARGADFGRDMLPEETIRRHDEA